MSCALLSKGRTRAGARSSGMESEGVRLPQESVVAWRKVSNRTNQLHMRSPFQYGKVSLRAECPRTEPVTVRSAVGRSPESLLLSWGSSLLLTRLTVS